MRLTLSLALVCLALAGLAAVQPSCLTLGGLGLCLMALAGHAAAAEGRTVPHAR